MPRRAKDFIEISDYTSLDALIRFLETIRDNLPEDCEPELKMRGDDVFGRRLTITYFRQLTEDEQALDARYGGNGGNDPDPIIEQLREQLDRVPYESSGKAAD